MVSLRAPDPGAEAPPCVILAAGKRRRDVSEAALHRAGGTHRLRSLRARVPVGGDFPGRAGPGASSRTTRPSTPRCSHASVRRAVTTPVLGVELRPDGFELLRLEAATAPPLLASGPAREAHDRRRDLGRPGARRLRLGRTGTAPGASAALLCAGPDPMRAARRRPSTTKHGHAVSIRGYQSDPWSEERPRRSARPVPKVGRPETRTIPEE